MASEIQIWCPHCYKQYQIPDGLGARRLRCKKCANSFAANAALTSDPANLLPPTKAASAAAADIVQAIEIAPNQPAPKEDITSYFKTPHAAGAASSLGSSSGGNESTNNPANVRHVSSPMMIPAVIGAVLFRFSCAVSPWDIPGFNPLQRLSLPLSAPVDSLGTMKLDRK